MYFPTECILGGTWSAYTCWKNCRFRRGRTVSSFSMSAVIRRRRSFGADVGVTSGGKPSLLSPAANHLPSALTGLRLHRQRWRRRGVRQELGDGFITAGSGQREVFDCGSHMNSEWSELESGYWMIWYLKPSRTGSKVLMTLGKIFFWAPC